MGQKFCTICGSVLTEGVKFCENCGAAVEQPSPTSTPSPVSLFPLPDSVPPPAALPKGNPMMKIIVGIVIVLVVLAGAVFFLVLPKMSGSGIPSTAPEGAGFTAASPSPTTVSVTTPTPVITTIVPTPPPDPFPDAYPVRKIFSFNEDKYASKATVYRYWVNDTYQWHSDSDNRYYTQKPKAGNKYLLVFVNIENIGTDGYPYPKANSIVVHNGGNVYYVDTSHYLPDKSGNRKATAIEIQELEHQSDFFNMERVEDYGYSHGTTQDFVNPGQGNAIDGYLIYEIPASLTPENTYVEIVFDGQDRNVWKLG
jgi:hypothetical protein